MALESIRNLIQDDLSATDQFIITQLASNIPMIKDVIEYVLSCGGKRIRPLMVLLSAKALSNSKNPDKAVDLAAVIELIHTATLLHDDVVDDSTLRRGHDTAHMIWGNDASILVGDFLYSRAFQIVVGLNNYAALEIFSSATHFMAEGEIMQLVNCKNPDTTEAFYYDIIERKTARLFEIATQLGALFATDSEADIKAMQQYGLHLGLAYQLIDDAIDYSSSSQEAGKNIGQDLSEGKMTLPLIYAMSQSTGSDLELLRNAIQQGCKQNLEAILSILKTTKAIEHTAEKAKHHAKLAQQALSAIPASPYKQALHDLSEFVVQRNH